jgi:hypothetical protein
MLAVCTSLSVRESRAGAGAATFSMEFVQTSEVAAPSQEIDAARATATSATAAAAAASASLASEVNFLGAPAFAVASSERAVIIAAEALRVALAPLARSTQELAQLSGECARLAARASSLVRQPADLLAGFRAAVATVADSAAQARRQFVQALLDAYGVDLGAPTQGVTSTRAREAANHQAITHALGREMLLEAARVAPLVRYGSLEEARAVRDRIASLLTEQAASASDALYPTIIKLRADVLRSIPGSAQLARVVDVERQESVPSLLLAYQIYGEVDRESELVARNNGRVSHPGFVVGALKALSDG